jgi:hypothetical protein
MPYFKATLDIQKHERDTTSLNPNSVIKNGTQSINKNVLVVPHVILPEIVIYTLCQEESV